MKTRAKRKCEMTMTWKATSTDTAEPWLMRDSLRESRRYIWEGFSYQQKLSSTTWLFSSLTAAERLTSFSSFSLSANLWLSLSDKFSSSSRFCSRKLLFKLPSITSLSPPPLLLAIWFNSQLSVLTSEFLDDTRESRPSSSGQTWTLSWETIGGKQ